MKHNKVMYAGVVISLASPKAASLCPSKASISQLASLLAASGTQTVQSFLSRKIAPTKNVSIFLWTIPGILGTSRTEKKKCAHSIGKCVCTLWASLQKDASAPNGTAEWGKQTSINTTGTEANPVSTDFTSTAPLRKTWHKRPVEWRQVHPFHPNQFPWIPSVPLFLVIKVPGITALCNSGKPQRQQLILFKDV